MRGSLALLALFCFACTSEKRPPELSKPVLSSLSSQALTAFTTHNASLLTRLAVEALSTDALADNKELAFALAEPQSVTVIHHMIECALAEGSSVEIPVEGGAPMTFEGSMGLAPEWADGPCEEACQEWVTSCMMARSNNYGVPVYFLMIGPIPDESGEEVAEIPEQYSVLEGAFYGNLFVDRGVAYSCRGSGYDPLYNSFRVCTDPDRPCGMINVGTCGAINGDTAEPSDRHACEVQPTKERPFYERCRNRMTLPGEETFPEPNKLYTRVLTSYVTPSGFRTGLSASGFGTPDGPTMCGDPLPPARPELPIDPGPQLPGRCKNEDQCDSEILNCDPQSDAGFCTAVCMPSPIASFEEEVCGGAGATCLEAFDGSGACLRSCVATANGGGGCAKGFVCTRSATGGEDTQAACYPFCQDDRDCWSQQKCLPREGVCELTRREGTQVDGTPCDPLAPNVCRGFCYVVGPAAEHGLCASAVNLDVSRNCPDYPMARMAPISSIPSRDEDLGICVFLRCANNDECPAPLICRPEIIGGACSYPG